VRKQQNMVYDFRNLLIQLRSIRPPSIGETGIREIKYWYDEAGNRTRKQVWSYQGSEPDPVYEGDNPSWQLESQEFYVRDVNGKEVAIYSGSNLTQWNLWGLDQIGEMHTDTSKYFYLKDHLGSVRAVINTQNQVTSAQDYDAWGYLHDTRTYSANNKYKFTGKERDLESNYDYFGARYYDSRIANWTSLDPLFEKHFDYTPYNYVLRNPLYYIDPDGRQIWWQAFEIILKQVGKWAIKKDPPPGGFGKEGEDVDNDGVPDWYDHYDNRTPEQKEFEKSEEGKKWLKEFGEKVPKYVKEIKEENERKKFDEMTKNIEEQKKKEKDQEEKYRKKEIKEKENDKGPVGKTFTPSEDR